MIFKDMLDSIDKFFTDLFDDKSKTKVIKNKPSDQQQLRTRGGITNVNNMGDRTVYITKESGKNIGDSKISTKTDNTPPELKLIYQTSMAKCLEGQSYHLIDNGNKPPEKMAVLGNCSGVFEYGDKIGICRADSSGGVLSKTVYSECDMDKISVLKNSYIVGFADANLKLIDEYSKNKCIINGKNNFGQDDYGTMYVGPGCEGIFQLGPTIGRCISEQDKVKASKQGIKPPVKYKAKTTCQVGHVVQNTHGEWVGLDAARLYVPHGTSSASCDPQNMQNNIEYSGDHFTLKNNCSSRYGWGPISGSCQATKTNNKCMIGKTVTLEGKQVGLIAKPIDEFYM
jgi:hypothetical protein